MASATVTIIGNTYPVREGLRALGGRWNANAKGWDVPTANAAAARSLVTPAKPVARKSRCPNPSDCGDPTCNGGCGY